MLLYKTSSDRVQSTIYHRCFEALQRRAIWGDRTNCSHSDHKTHERKYFLETTLPMAAKSCLSVGPASRKDDRTSFLNWPSKRTSFVNALASEEKVS
jgi:hypothetical protein